MTTVGLGLLSAVAWGTADFGGGYLSRRAPVFGVVLISLAVPLVVTIVGSASLGEPLPTPPDLAWATLAGASAALGILGLYHGLGVGRMSVVAPVTGVLAATIPVVVGIVVQGVPSAAVLAGIVLALVAVVLVSRVAGDDPDRPSGLRFGLGAGVGLGLFNVFAAQLAPVSFVGHLAVIKGVELIVVAGAVVLARQPVRVPRRLVPAIGAVGLLDLVGNGAFILAAQVGQLAVASVLSSLYPVTTIVLATTVLRERVTRSHAVGIALAAVAIVLIAAAPALASSP
jgi:drug/metabolite transporter (DMT)-like permease